MKERRHEVDGVRDFREHPNPAPCIKGVVDSRCTCTTIELENPADAQLREPSLQDTHGTFAFAFAFAFDAALC
jgi:hypothetical protein